MEKKITDKEGNSLILEVTKVDTTDDSRMIWVKSTYGDKVKYMCYECMNTNNIWDFVDGDDEHYLPDEIKRRWLGREGDDILEELFNCCTW